MLLADERRIEYELDLGLQEFLVVGVHYEPAQFGPEGPDHHVILVQAVEEELPRRAALSGPRGIADEIARFQAFARRGFVGQRRAACKQEDGAKHEQSHGVTIVHGAESVTRAGFQRQG